MEKVAVYDIQGKITGELELNPAVFGFEPKKHLIHKAVVTYLANKREGNAKCKSRSEVTGSTKKLFKQKGTGGARRGNIKSPVLVGGGKTFGPKVRDYFLKMNKKEKIAARKSAYSDKAMSTAIRVFDNFDIDVPKTAKFIEVLKGMEVLGKKVLILVDSYSYLDSDEKYNRAVNILKSCRNIKNVKYQVADTVSTYEIVNSDYLVIQKDALQTIDKVNK
ncbi:MAG: 50S ribosomal protein L4 [Candidatus Delongbacteria bacterium]|nr:50S ribosomal protein L4 [Candidatus Delongbacteria bacterium]MBN2836436.1 50S ribosomal protein L4 [Candidatus Delongbacteria bacterium]